MPNLEPRYLPTDGKQHDAWIFGLLDALDFFESARTEEIMTHAKYMRTLAYLSKDIAESYRSKLERDFGIDLSGDTLPLSTTSRDADGKATQDTTSRSARTWEDTGGPDSFRASGFIQSERLARDAYSNASRERKDSMDRHNRTVRDASIPDSRSYRFIEWFQRKETGDTKFGTRKRSYPSDNRSS